jgi:hypothetical protein
MVKMSAETGSEGWVSIRESADRQTLVSLLLNKQNALTNIAAVVAVLTGRSDVVDVYGALLSRDSSNG